MLQKFIKFAIVGGIATAFQYAILVLLVEYFTIDAVIASAIGFVASAVLNYRLNYTFTFNSNQAHHFAFPKFFVTASIGLLINTGAIYILIEKLDLHYLLSQLAATALTLAWSFAVNSLWTFQSNEKRTGQ